MSDIIEVEQKYKLTQSVDIFLTKLKGLGASYVSETRQIDTYFNVPGRDSLSTKECLRIRKSGESVEMTYKAPTPAEMKAMNHYAKEEININIKNESEARNFLMALGCELLVVVDKFRKSYTLDRITIAIDTVAGVGSFIELEALVPSTQQENAIQSIGTVVNGLGLSQSDLVLEPYRDLALEVNQ